MDASFADFRLALEIEPSVTCDEAAKISPELRRRLRMQKIYLRVVKNKAIILIAFSLFDQGWAIAKVMRQLDVPANKAERWRRVWGRVKKWSKIFERRTGKLRELELEGTKPDSSQARVFNMIELVEKVGEIAMRPAA